MYFDIHKTTSGHEEKYWWVAKGYNNETMCQSRMLSSKEACISSIRTLKNEAAGANVYDETGERPGGPEERLITV